MSVEILKINKLNYTLPGKKIICNLTMRVLVGEFIILVGANGSGKTTLLQLINKSLTRSSGEICCMGTPIDDISAKHFTRDVMLLSQSPDKNLCMGMTIVEHMLLYCPEEYRNIKALNTVAAYLDQFNHNLKQYLQQPIDALSGGEKQALALALVALCKPKLLLLDEHTAALDPVASTEIMRLTKKIVRENCITCIMTTHNMQHVRQYGDKIMALRGGNFFASVSQKCDNVRALDLVLESCF